MTLSVPPDPTAGLWGCMLQAFTRRTPLAAGSGCGCEPGSLLCCSAAGLGASVMLRLQLCAQGTVPARLSACLPCYTS